MEKLVSKEMRIERLANGKIRYVPYAIYQPSGFLGFLKCKRLHVYKYEGVQ